MYKAKMFLRVVIAVISIFFLITVLGINYKATAEIVKETTLYNTTQGFVIKGEKVTATSSMKGNIYFVPYLDAATKITVNQLNQYINSKKGIRVSSNANKAVFIETNNLSTGVYIFYSVDSKGKISNPSSKIYLEDVTPSPNESKIELVQQGPVGTNQVMINISIKNRDRYGIGGFQAKDFTIEVSENGEEFIKYSLADTNKFSQFKTGIFWASGDYYAVNYQAKGTSVLVKIRNLKIGDLLLDSNTYEKTTLPNEIFPSIDKSNYNFVRYGTKGEAFLNLYIYDQNGDPLIGLNAADFKVFLENKSVTITHNFVEKYPGYYEAMLKTNTDTDFNKKIIVKNMIIKEQKYTIEALSGKKNVFWAMFDSSSAAYPGTKQDRISIYVINEKREGIIGLASSDFSLRINGGNVIKLSNPIFTGFKDMGGGNYEIYFNGNKEDTLYKVTDFSVKNYKSQETEILKTSKPKSPHKLYIATEY